MDYFWISLGITGVIGATYSLRKEISDKSSHQIDESIKFNYQEFQNTIDWNKRYYSEKNGFRYDLFKDQTQARNFKRAGLYFDSLLNKTKNLRDTILISKELKYIDTLSTYYNQTLISIGDNYVSETSKYAKESLKNLENSRTNYLNNEELKAKGFWSYILLITSPYLFSVALALRLTKVTAELIELKGKA